MIIEIPGRDDLRICGEGTDWQVQSVYKNGKRAGEWFGTNFFSGAEFAVGFVYEKLLRDKDAAIQVGDLPNECKRVKEDLMKSVRKAVG